MKKWIVMLFAIIGSFAYGGHEDREHPARSPGRDLSGLTSTMVAMLDLSFDEPAVTP